MKNITVRAINPQDFEQWVKLYASYIAFCGRTSIDRQSINALWQWLMQQKVYCTVAVDKGEFVGFTHAQELYSPLNGRLTGYLEDFFVIEKYRGKGVAEKLIENLRQLGKSKDWLFIRWKTKETNLRAQAFHNKIAKKTKWLTYQLNLE